MLLPPSLGKFLPVCLPCCMHARRLSSLSICLLDLIASSCRSSLLHAKLLTYKYCLLTCSSSSSSSSSSSTCLLDWIASSPLEPFPLLQRGYSRLCFLLAFCGETNGRIVKLCFSPNTTKQENTASSDQKLPPAEQNGEEMSEKVHLHAYHDPKFLKQSRN